MGRKKSLVGARNLNRRDQLMTVTRERAEGLDVCFANGLTVHNVDQMDFSAGRVKCPRHHLNNEEARAAYEGFSNRNTQGELFMVTRYRNGGDIDVVFSDGTIRQHATMQQAKNGSLRNPSKPLKYGTRGKDWVKRKRHLYEVSLATNGQRMTLIDWTACNDIKVRFEDGEEVTGKEYRRFLTGNIRNPKRPVSTGRKAMVERTGEKVLNAKGEELEVIEYRRSDDIDVRLADGRVVTTTYTAFLKGAV